MTFKSLMTSTPALDEWCLLIEYYYAAGTYIRVTLAKRAQYTSIQDTAFCFPVKQINNIGLRELRHPKQSSRVLRTPSSYWLSLPSSPDTMSIPPQDVVRNGPNVCLVHPFPYPRNEVSPYLLTAVSSEDSPTERISIDPLVMFLDTHYIFRKNDVDDGIAALEFNNCHLTVFPFPQPLSRISP